MRIVVVIGFFMLVFLSSCLVAKDLSLNTNISLSTSLPLNTHLSLSTQESILVQGSGPSIHRIGLLSDIHGHLDKLDGFLKRFKELKVEIILVAGDSVLNEELSYGRLDRIEDEVELEGVLNHLEGAKVPVLVIPGNHEGQRIYNDAFSVKRLQIWDLVHYRFVDLKGLDIVSLPGYYIEADKTHQFLPADGFFLSEEAIENVSVLLKFKRDKDPVLVITHGPPLSNLEKGVDVVPGVGHTGSWALKKAWLENNVSFAVFGHIHEAGPQAENTTDRIPEGVFSDRMWINTGAVQEGHAGWLEVEGKEARFVSLSD